MREDAAVGLPLLQLSATDADVADNARLQYELCTRDDDDDDDDDDDVPQAAEPDRSSSTEPSPQPVVSVDANTGWIYTATTLDYETLQQV